MGLYLAEPALPRFAPMTDADFPQVSSAAWEYEQSRQLAALTADDLIDELFDSREQMLTLARMGKADALGQLVIDAMQAYVLRCADRALS